MILFNFPEERSTPFYSYLPPDLLEQVKAHLPSPNRYRIAVRYKKNGLAALIQGTVRPLP